MFRTRHGLLTEGLVHEADLGIDVPAALLLEREVDGLRGAHAFGAEASDRGRRSRVTALRQLDGETVEGGESGGAVGTGDSVHLHCLAVCVKLGKAVLSEMMINTGYPRLKLDG